MDEGRHDGAREQYEASIANMTHRDGPRGTGGSLQEKIGTKTMQMQASRRTPTGDLWPRSRVARTSGFSCAGSGRCSRSPRSRRPPGCRPRAPVPEGHRDDRLVEGVQADDRAEDRERIESATTSVLRHARGRGGSSPAVRSAAITASLMTPVSAARTKTDWSNSGFNSRSGGRVLLICGSTAFTRR